jgi:ABC-type glycerol-3-phosphate transport system substrate-binding protein
VKAARTSRRRLLLGALPLLALAACRPPDKIMSGPVAQIALPKQISLIVPVPDQPSADRLLGRIKDYQSVNPNVLIDLRPINGMPRGPFDVDKWVDLLQGVASAAQLDAAIGWDVWAPGMIDRGILRPLDPYLADIGRPLERYFMNASVQAFRRSGRVWMLPWQAQPAMVFYNRQLFDQAGLPPLERRWSWRDLESVGGQLSRGQDKSRVWGFDIGTGPEALIYENGGRIVDDPVEPTRPTLDDLANIDALAWVDDLIKRLKIIPGTTDARDRMGAFASAQIAMRLDRMGVRAGTYVGSPKPWTFPWAAAPPPGRVTQATTANFQSWGILSSSLQVDDAWGFIRHLCTRLPAEAKIDGVPAFLSLQDSPDLGRLLPEGTSSYLAALSETIPTPAVPAATAMQNLLAQALFKVVASQATPADALREAQQGALKAWGVKPTPTPAPQQPGT